MIQNIPYAFQHWHKVYSLSDIGEFSFFNIRLKKFLASSPLSVGVALIGLAINE